MFRGFMHYLGVAVVSGFAASCLLFGLKLLVEFALGKHK